MTPTPQTKKKRGRPPMTWVTLAELAAQLGLESPAPLARLLLFFPGVFPGAQTDAKHGWIFPSTTLSALKRGRVGIDLAQEATVQEVAAAIRRSVSTIHRWCQPGPAGEPPLLLSRKVAGSVLIDVRSVLALPAKLPDWLASGVKQMRQQMVCGQEKVSAMSGAVDQESAVSASQSGYK